jgi:hypothetical protein
MIECHRRKVVVFTAAHAAVYTPVGHESCLEKEFEMQRALVGMLLLVGLLFAACGAPAPAQTQADASGKPLVTVYRSPT